MPGEDTPLRRLDKSFAPKLADFHMRNLGGQLSWLGLSYVRYFYEAVLELDGVLGWAAFDGADLAGFVLGSIRRDKILIALIRSDPWRWIAASVRSALTHPWAFLKVALNAASESAAPQDRHAEIYFIAVDKLQRGKHIGQRLLRAYSGECAAHGVLRFALSVRQDNVGANAFYRANGGQAVADYVEAGEPMRRYLFLSERYPE